MTDYFPLVPSRRSAPTFKPTLDGKVHTCTVTWNLAGQRFFLNVFTLAGDRVLSLAVAETSPDTPITALSYNGVTGLASLSLPSPHGLQIGQTASRRISGCDVDAFNGAQTVYATGPLTLSFPIPAAPLEAPIILGSLGAPIDLLAGYFDTVLIYRAGRFEVG